VRRREVLGSLGGVLGAALVPSCTASRPKPVDFAEVTRGYTPKEYAEVFQRWTRHAKLVRDVGTVIELWSTYKSWDFRQAYIEQYADAYSLTEAERKALGQAQREAARSTYEFHLVAQSTDYDWNDLEQKDSVWKISLADRTGAEIAPDNVAAEKLPALYEMRFFPTSTDFSRTYTVRFPRSTVDGERGFLGSASGRLVLRVAGPLGRAEVDWESGGRKGQPPIG
jgi:hypothetical protein